MQAVRIEPSIVWSEMWMWNFLPKGRNGGLAFVLHICDISQYENYFERFYTFYLFIFDTIKHEYIKI